MSDDPSETHTEAIHSDSILDADGFVVASRLINDLSEPDSVEDFGPYHVVRRLGSGGMGEVFLAADQVAERFVAIKVLLHPWAEPDLRKRFAQEIKTLARLEHPFIARLYDVGIHTASTPYFVMEYVDGLPLDRYCLEREFSVTEKLKLFRSVCEAVNYAHSRLVLHRDLKPSNILITSDGTPKLLDFGIAKQLEEAQLAVDQTQTKLRFTRAYAAPEQIRREPVGVYTDIYALGVMLYELLSGKAPYDLDACTPVEAELLIAGDKEPEKPSVVAQRSLSAINDRRHPDKAAWNDLDVLCLKAMRKDIGRRYPSVIELIQDIDRFLSGEPLRARPDALGYRAHKFVKRNRHTVAAVSLVVLLVVGLVAFFTVRLARARDVAVAEAARTRRIREFMLDMFDSRDQQAGPSNEMRVVTLLDRSAREAGSLKADPETQADVYVTLGRLYQQLGRPQEANKFLTLAVEKTKAALGPDNPRTAAALVQLGLLRGDQAQVKDAVQLIREGIGIAKRQLPADSVELLDDQSSLGRVLAQSGSYDEAIQILDPIVKRQLPGEQGTMVLLESLTALAYAEQSSGRYANAEVHHRRALDLDRKIHGNVHPRVATDLANLGSNATALSHYADAERLYREASDIMIAWYGPDHPSSIQVKAFLGRVLVAEGKDQEASALLKAALPQLQKTYGDLHPYVAVTLDSLARLERKRGDRNAAVRDFDRAFRIEKSVLGLTETHTTLSGVNLADALTEEKQYAQAELILREILTAHLKKPPADDLGKGLAQAGLGRLLLRQKHYPEAEKQLSSAYAILRHQAAPQTVWLHHAQEDLAALYEAVKEPQKASAIRAEVLPDRSTAR